MYTRCYRDWSSDVCSSDQRASAGMLTDEQQEKIAPFCPNFVAELMSPSDKRPVRFRMLQAKMNEYMANGAQLGWLIDPFNKQVYVYRPGEGIQSLDNPSTTSGDPVL